MRFPSLYRPPRVYALGLFVYVAATVVTQADGAFGLNIMPARAAQYIAPIIAALYLGAWRVATRHPFFSEPYFLWLATSPWRPNRPLPGGPLTLVAADGIYVGLLCLLYGLLVPSSFAAVAAAPALVFLWAYMLTSAIAVAFLARPLLYGFMAVAFGGFLLPAYLPLFAIFTLVLALYIHFATRWLLVRFPWRTPEGDPRIAPKKFFQMKLEAASVPAMQGIDAGWPAMHLMDVPDGPRIPFEDGLAVAALLAWGAFTITHAALRSGGPNFLGACEVLVIGAAAIRAYLYLRGTRAPISLLGRLRLGRPILPRYDVAYVAPLCAALTPWIVGQVHDLLAAPKHQLAVMLSLWRPAPLHIASLAALTVFVGMGLVLLAPPSLRWWRLAGAHRTDAPPQLKRNPQIGLWQI